MTGFIPFAHPRVVRPAATLTLLASLAACGSMAGVGGSSDYACKAPDGVKCDSVSGTYANALQRNLPSQRQGRPAPPPDGATPSRLSPPALPHASHTSAHAAAMPTALRSEARILRLWVKPWEDSDGALHDQSYVYLQTDNGRWLLDHAQRQIRDRHAPLRPPRTVAAANDPVSSAADSAVRNAAAGTAPPVRPLATAADDDK